MKGSIISAITFAIAVAALPSMDPKDKGGDIISNQCKSGTLQCCVHADQVEDSGLVHLLDGFTLLNVEAYCSPIKVLSDIHVNLLGGDGEKDPNTDCRHTVSCCNANKCDPVGDSYGSE